MGTHVECQVKAAGYPLTEDMVASGAPWYCSEASEQEQGRERYMERERRTGAPAHHTTHPTSHAHGTPSPALPLFTLHT